MQILNQSGMYYVDSMYIRIPMRTVVEVPCVLHCQMHVHVLPLVLEAHVTVIDIRINSRPVSH